MRVKNSVASQVASYPETASQLASYPGTASQVAGYPRTASRWASYLAVLLVAVAACNSERMPEKRGPGEGFAWPTESAPATSLSPSEPPSPSTSPVQPPSSPAAPTPAPATTPAALPTPAPATDLHLGRPIELTAAQKKLVFQDDFNRAQLGPDYKFQGGDWQIKDDAVHSTKALNKCLWLQKPLPADAVVELEAASMSPRGDVKFTVFADGAEHETGYTLILGGWFNTISVIARSDEHGADRKERQHKGAVTPGRRHKFEMRRIGGRIDWFVDGAAYLSYDDPKPFRGAGHDRFAFCNWESPVFFDNLRVYEITAPAAVAPTPASPAAPAPALLQPTLPILKRKNPPPRKGALPAAP